VSYYSDHVYSYAIIGKYLYGRHLSQYKRWKNDLDGCIIPSQT
jgi:hypothetical protein